MHGCNRLIWPSSQTSDRCIIDHPAWVGTGLRIEARRLAASALALCNVALGHVHQWLKPESCTGTGTHLPSCPGKASPNGMPSLS